MDMLGYMLLLSTVVPVTGSIVVAIHWLLTDCLVRRNTRTYHRIDGQVRAEAAAKFPENDRSSYDWISQEEEKRLQAAGFKNTGGISPSDFDAAQYVGSYPMPVAQHMDQWILIVTAIIGVILMGFGK
jgi:hypothetical protein